MGLFKQMKDLKKTVEAAPGLVSQAQQMAAQAQQMQAAQQAAAQQATAQATAGAAAGADFEPIAGVSLEQYVAISRECAAYPGDFAKAAAIAASHGISDESWQAAMNGWNARMHNVAVAQRFNQLYTAA